MFTRMKRKLKRIRRRPHNPHHYCRFYNILRQDIDPSLCRQCDLYHHDGKLGECPGWVRNEIIKM